MLVSPAPALAPVARFCRLAGLRLVRGTSGDRGAHARVELVQRLRAGVSIILAVDGPAGPVFKIKRGCAAIALQAGAPIVALRFRSRRGVTLRWRWDQTLLPVPFDDITVIHGPRITGATEAELLTRVADSLEALERA